MAVGGMFNVLKILYKHIKDKEDFTITFTLQEVMDLTNLSKQAVINNMSRLVKVKLVLREYYCVPGQRGAKKVKYKIKDVDIIDYMETYFR